jgi:hypothetical protein
VQINRETAKFRHDEPREQEQFLTLDYFLSKDTKQLLKGFDHEFAVTVPNRTMEGKEEFKSPLASSTSKLEVDKDEIRRRQHAQEMKRKLEIEELKRKAKEKDEARKIKIRSAICIQRWVRGHLVRTEMRRKQVNYKYMRKLRRLLSVAIGRRRKLALRKLK